MKHKITIAIDGPAASGKSTTAKRLAQKLNYLYIDTGAMYRAATLAVLRAGIAAEDRTAVEACVRDNAIRLERNQDGQRTLLNDEDVTEQIRTPEINRVISVIASYAGVREIMVRQQRALSAAGGVVMDGRDIGTVVLPDADLKVFMVASIEARARRRLRELQDAGEQVMLDDVRKEIENRDQIDSSRSHSPLKQAADARVLDTSNLTIEQQVETIFGWAQEIIQGRT